MSSSVMNNFINKKILTRTIIFLIIFVILRFIIIYGLNLLNINSSNYIKSNHNEVNIKMPIKNHLYAISNTQIKDNELKLYIKVNNKEPLSILIDNLNYPHKIYKDNILISQNIDKKDINYDGRYAYKVFEIKENTTLSIVGEEVSHTKLFLANKNVMLEYTDIRIFLFSSMLLLLALFTIISVFFYVKNKNAKYFLAFVIMGIASIIKAIYMGEIYPLVKIIYLPINNITTINQMIHIICGFLPILIMLYLFEININKKTKIVFFIYIIILCILELSGYCSKSIIKLAILIGLVPIDIIINYYAFIKNKRFCLPILINNVLFSSLSNYQSTIDFEILNAGIFNFIINFSFLGIVIYMYGFLFIFIKDYFDKVKQLKNKEEEYNRISLFRGISHDLKLPLSIIKSSYEIIDSYEITNKEKDECIKVGNEAIDELENMVENIGCYLKSKKINLSNTSIKNTFNKLEKHFHLQNKENNYDFEVNKDGKDYIININPHQFYRMMYNIIDNAFKYTPKGGNITVSYLIETDVEIIIKDTGIGIDKDKIDKIFEPFYRIDDSRNIDGLGIGLSVVKEIVESANGIIKVDSEKNKGTKFSIIFRI